MSSPTLTTTPLDVHDDAELARWHEVYAAALEQTSGHRDLCWTPEQVRVQVGEPTSARRQTAWCGRVDGELVAAGGLGLPLLDNTDSAQLEVFVHPRWQRRGLGSQLLAHLERTAAEHGRHLLDGETHWRHELGTDGVGAAGVAFGAHHGYALVLSDVERRLSLPVPDALLDELAAEAAAHHAGYTLRAWVGTVPDELAESWLELESSLVTEAPTGDRLVEPDSGDLAALRETEAQIAKQGRDRYHAVALDPGGRVAAYTDVMVERDPQLAQRAFQWGTLVRRADRGHRLGLAVKVANLRQLQARAPHVREVVTYNAEVNAHMIGVNDRLGFRAVGRLGELQKVLPRA